MTVQEAAVAYKTLYPIKSGNTKVKAKVIPVYRWSSFDKIEAIKNGITKDDLQSIKDQAALDYDSLSVILNVAKATLHNKKGKEKFDQYISERILLIADLYSYGYEVFQSKERFNQWMKTSIRALGNVTPLHLIDTLYGIEEVKHLIGRIEYGVYS